MHYISDPRACYISDPPSQVSMTLNANQGNEVVHENQRVTFDCTAGDGRPTPTVRLVRPSQRDGGAQRVVPPDVQCDGEV